MLHVLSETEKARAFTIRQRLERLGVRKPAIKTIPKIAEPEILESPPPKINFAQAMFDWNCLQYFNSLFEPVPVVIAPPAITRVTVDAVLRAVAARYAVSCIDICSHRRTTEIVRPRQVSMWLCKTLTLRSLPDIGRRMGGRDHTTVLHGVRKIERLRQSNPDLQLELDQFVSALRPHSPENDNAEDTARTGC